MLTLAQQTHLESWLSKKLIKDYVTTHIQSGKWPNYRPEKLYEICLREEQRHKEGWYKSFRDTYEDTFREFAGDDPVDKGTSEERFIEARSLVYTDCREAVSKLMQLAEDGYLPAVRIAAELFTDGMYLLPNRELALSYAKRAYEAGCKSVYALYAYLLADSDPRLGKALFKKALKERAPGNARFLGRMYAEGLYARCSSSRAEECYRKALEEGDISAISDYLSLVLAVDSNNIDHAMTKLFDYAEIKYPPALVLLSKVLFLSLARADDGLYERLLKLAAALAGQAAKQRYFDAITFLRSGREYIGRDGELVRPIDLVDDEARIKCCPAVDYQMSVDDQTERDADFIEWLGR